MKASKVILYEMLKEAVMPLKEAIRENYKEVYNTDDENTPAGKTVSDLLEMASDVCFEFEMEGIEYASGSMDS